MGPRLFLKLEGEREPFHVAGGCVAHGSWRGGRETLSALPSPATRHARRPWMANLLPWLRCEVPAVGPAHGPGRLCLFLDCPRRSSLTCVDGEMRCQGLIGGAAIDAEGSPWPASSVAQAKVRYQVCCSIPSPKWRPRVRLRLRLRLRLRPTRAPWLVASPVSLVARSDGATARLTYGASISMADGLGDEDDQGVS